MKQPSLCEVVKVEDQWYVYAVNPNNPNDNRLINICETEDYANRLANDVNRLAEMPYEQDNTAGAKQEDRPKRRFLFDPETGERPVRFED